MATPGGAFYNALLGVTTQGYTTTNYDPWGAYYNQALLAQHFNGNPDLHYWQTPAEREVIRMRELMDKQLRFEPGACFNIEEKAVGTPDPWVALTNHAWYELLAKFGEMSK